ncbi:MAG: AAA family ATPase [Alphaproteobacteria bacterium]|nr:AAA family ATPase [Alphaproteobacteria bacterium]
MNNSKSNENPMKQDNYNAQEPFVDQFESGEILKDVSHSENKTLRDIGIPETAVTGTVHASGAVTENPVERPEDNRSSMAEIIKFEAEELKRRSQNSYPDYIKTGFDLMNRGPSQRQEYLWGPYLSRKGISVIYGSSDTGKSKLMLQLCMEIVHKNETFLGFDLKPKHHRALFISAEDNDDDFERVLEMQKDLIDQKYAQNFCIIFGSDNIEEKVQSFLEQFPVDLIVVDCFTDVYAKDINDNSAVRRFYADFDKIINAHGCQIIFIHHSGKNKEFGPPNKGNSVGTQAITAKPRFVMELRNESGGDPDVRHLWITKANNLGSSEKRKSIELKFDETVLRFTPTGKRHSIVEDEPEKAHSNRPELYKTAYRLKEEGQNLDQIKGAVGFRSKGSVSKLIQEGDNKGWSKNEAE